MSWDFEVEGWEDRAGNRHGGKPDDIDNTFGTLVHAYDDETGEHHFFWAFTVVSLDDWGDWYDVIVGLMGMYGMAME